MKFLDKKEQVLELKLTQYGKSLLSRGVFKPTYYAFYDDDVIYDRQYMASASSSPLEHPTKASDRIRKSVRPEPQYNYAGVETTINQLAETSVETIGFIGSQGPVLENTTVSELTLEQKLEALSKPPSAIDNYYSMGLPMGTSDYNSDKAPAWNLKFLEGEISGSVVDYTGSSGLIKIPQLEVEAFYDVETKQFTSVSDKPSEESNITTFPDNSYIEIEKNHIMVDFGEYNSLFENENFDIEVYEVIEQPSTNQLKQTLDSLYFIKSEKNNSQEYFLENGNEKLEINSKNVEYYFDVRVDDEIDDDIGIIDSANIYKTVPENDKEPC
jgi:predicted HicB family RNase H-like nuclease